MTRDELIRYIKVLCSIAGCDSYYAKKFKCDMYLDCESCLEDKIIEHDKQIREEVIDEYKNALHIKYEENKGFAYAVSKGNIYKFDAMANLDLEEIDEIAEELKAGGKNE